MALFRLGSFIRELAQSLLKRTLYGLAASLGPLSPGVRPLIDRFVTPSALSGLRASRPKELVFEKARTRWIVEEIHPDQVTRKVARNQMYAVDVVVVGPDGQVITLQGVVLPTGRAFDSKAFERRLAAELKRLESKEKIKPIGDDPSDYIERSVIEYDVYRYTITPLKA